MSKNGASEYTIIEAKNGWHHIHFKELFDYRELIAFLAWRDIMAQYKQAFFGISWALVRPVFSVLIYTLVFGKVAKLSSSGLPYPIFTLCGVVAWSLFASSLSQSTASLLNNKNLLTKIYFPRLIIPIASLGRGVVDFIISFILFIALFFIYKIQISAHLLFFPIFLAIGLLLTLGIGLIFSALSTRYYDLKHVIPFFVQMWFWMTPVAYGIENIPENLKFLFYLNPMTWIIQGFRWSLMGIGMMSWSRILIAGIMSIAVFAFGLLYFRKMEDSFADII